jgi:hypothetical protein
MVIAAASFPVDASLAPPPLVLLPQEPCANATASTLNTAPFLSLSLNLLMVYIPFRL